MLSNLGRNPSVDHLARRELGRLGEIQVQDCRYAAPVAVGVPRFVEAIVDQIEMKALATVVASPDFLLARCH